MNKRTFYLLFVFSMMLFSCAPKNSEVSNESIEFAGVKLEIWRNKMPTIPPSEQKVICIFTVDIDQMAVFEEARLEAGMIKDSEGKNLSSVSFDSSMVFTSKREEGPIDVRAEVDYPEKIVDGEKVIGCLLFFIDGDMVEIETPAAVVKTVY